MYNEKKFAITGINGSLGKSLSLKLREKGAFVIGLTHRKKNIENNNINTNNHANETYIWDINHEKELELLLENIDVLILNHGVNFRGDQTFAKFDKSIQINALSIWKLINIFESLCIKKNIDSSKKEIWVNTSESELIPSLSYSYEISKRLIGKLMSYKIFNLKKKNQNLIIRKIILGPFKSKLNPRGFMKSDFVANRILEQAKSGKRLIIVSPYFFSYIIFPLNELGKNFYFKLINLLNSLLEK